MDAAYRDEVAQRKAEMSARVKAQKEEQRRLVTEQRNACVKALEDIIDRVQVWKKRQYAATKFDEAWARWKEQEHWEDSVDTVETVLDKSEELISG